MADHDDTVPPPRTTNTREQAAVPPYESAGKLAAILDRYMSDLQMGKGPDKDELLAAHPDLATELEACLAGIEFIHRATGPATQEPAILGEFRIIRELGRGGMGVVYEAEQTTLRRHVALKVLRFGVVADEEAMKRFQREAETVARLHHTNIVPIFAVGCERGVNYYAMQLIDGRSLADVQAESRRAGTPLPAEDVARWGLQAAEALAHAHQRGVIHRDIKPSNLLLDSDGVVWLTDFGLAKRADEATLTLHGTLMGTPRYMSPEQAASLQQPIDGRTDLYSLGASLYELATGYPLFEAAAAHVVIAQILTEEPARPRQLRPELPRDLETIIVTCLAKEPAKRYPSAQALASDLRAVIEGRPVQARRAPLLERAVRYVRQRRKTLKGAGLAAAATVLLMLSAFAAWRYYSDWRLGRIVLTTDGPSLTAQVLPEASDEPIGEPFSIGARSVMSLPAGDYRLRVQAPGLMGQTYRLAFNRGETRTHRVTLDDNRLLGNESIAFSPVVTALPLSPGKADFIEWTGASLIRRDGSTGKPIWDARGQGLLRGGGPKPPGTLVEPAPDLDGDGTGDLVWAMHRTPAFLALSGKDGSLLWTYTTSAGGSGGPHLPPPASPGQLPPLGRVVGVPRAADVDGDSLPDLVAEFAVFDDPENVLGRPGEPGETDVKAETVLPGRRVVVAVSGRSGKELWNHVIDENPVDLPAETFDRGIVHLSQPAGPLVAVADGSKWIGLDPATGRPKGPAIDLGFTPVQAVQHADLDGDGTMEILALEPWKGGEPLTAPILTAFSTTTGKRLWVSKLMAYFKPQHGVRAREWLLAVDVDGDGRAEVVVPDVGALPPRRVRGYGGVRMLDGATGQTRWVRPLWPGMQSATDSLAHQLVAPDLDADGISDLVVVSRFSGRIKHERFAGMPAEPTRVFVDALSGKDGQRLWEWHTEVGEWDSTPIWPVFWWGRRPDGWPMLAVPIGGSLAPGIAPKAPFYGFYPPVPPVVHLLAAATGREAHCIDGLSRAATADLDGDGLDDLWGSAGDKLLAFRALAPEAWRTLGRLQAAGDFDGDGMTDLLSNDLEPTHPKWGEKTDSRTALARSGRNGRILWRTQLDPWEDIFYREKLTKSYTLNPLRLPGGDLDGDGAPDIVVRREADGFALLNQKPTTFPLQALSGRTGQLLWSAGSVKLVPPSGTRPHDELPIYGIDARAGDPRGLPDVLVIYEAFFKKNVIIGRAFHVQYRLALLSGRDGRVRWDVLLADDQMTRLMGFDHEFADFDGDGKLELVLLLERMGARRGTATPFELRILSLASGETRWIHPLNAGAATFAAFAIGDVDGDRRSEVVIRERLHQEAQASIEVTALDGVAGKARWTWRGGKAGDEPDSKSALCLADFAGSGLRDVCVLVGDAPGPRRLVILDAQGRQRASRDLTTDSLPTLQGTDVDGDGRDELLFHDAGRLWACRGDLTDLWSWRTGDPIREVIPGAPGRAATVVLSPCLGLDGATGHPIWSIGPAGSILRASDHQSLPRALAGPDGATSCRAAMPTTAEGTLLPCQGLAARPSAFRDDPRWQRPLPWVAPVEPYANPLVQMAMVATLMNVCIPLAILWLATRRRFWSVRLLLALPAMVAVALTGYSATVALIPDQPQPTVLPWWAVPLGVATWSMIGLPIVVCTAAVGSALAGRPWWRRGLLVAALLATILISVRLLSALPGMVAFARTGYSATGSLIPGQPLPTVPPWWAVPLGVAMLSMSGLPIVVYAAALGSALAGRRWWRMARLVAGALLAAILIGATMLEYDGLVEPLIEHCNWSGWHQAVYLGAYAVGALALSVRLARGVARLVSRLTGRARAVVSPSS